MWSPPLEVPLGGNITHSAPFPAQSECSVKVPIGHRNIHRKTEHIPLCTCLDGRGLGIICRVINYSYISCCFHETAVFLFHLRICFQRFESSWASRLCIIWLLVLKATSCYVWLLGGEMLSWASAIIYPQSSRSCHVLLTVSCGTLSASL